MRTNDGMTELMVEAQNVGARKVSVGARAKDGSTKWTAESGKVTTWLDGVWERMSARLGTNEVAGFVYVVKDGKLYAMPNAPRRGRAKGKAERRQARAAAPAKEAPTKKAKRAGTQARGKRQPTRLPLPIERTSAEAQARTAVDETLPTLLRRGADLCERLDKQLKQMSAERRQAGADVRAWKAEIEQESARAVVRGRGFDHTAKFETESRDARRGSGRTHVKSDGYRPDVDVRTTEEIA